MSRVSFPLLWRGCPQGGVGQKETSRAASGIINRWLINQRNFKMLIFRHSVKKIAFFNILMLVLSTFFCTFAYSHKSVRTIKCICKQL